MNFFSFSIRCINISKRDFKISFYNKFFHFAISFLLLFFKVIHLFSTASISSVSVMP